jgi:hypothetical protein
MLFCDSRNILKITAFLALGLIASLPMTTIVSNSTASSDELPLSPSSINILIERDENTDLISVNVSDTQLQLLLTGISYAAGFRIHGSIPSGPAVSFSCRRTPLTTALRQLLNKHNFGMILIFSSTTPEKIDDIFLVRKSSTAWTAGVLSDNNISVAAATHDQADSAVISEVLEHDAQIKDLLALADHAEPDTRVQALEALILHEGNSEVRARLIAAMSDQVSNVRSTAIALISSFITRWPDAEEATLGLLSDNSPSVRMIALIALHEASSIRFPEALRMANSDYDPEVRNIAREISGADLTDL